MMPSEAGRTAASANIKTVRRTIALSIGAAIFSCLFVLSFGYAQHAPHPHHVRIDVVAPPGVSDQAGTALAAAVPGGFDVRSAATEQVARDHLRHMSTGGALVEPAAGPVHVLTAGASGVPLQQAVNQALTAVARVQGRQAEQFDVVPLPRDDRAGLSAFAIELGLLVPAVIGAIGCYLLARHVRLWARVAGATGYVLVAAALGALVLDAGLGALTGAPWALFGDAAMIAAAFVLTVTALHTMFGLQGTAIAAGALLVVGNAVNGSAVPTPMLPDVYRQIAPWMPNNAAIHLVRSDMYFGGRGQGGPMLVLLVWIGAALLIIAAADVVHVRARRLGPERTQQIYATPILGHLRARRAASAHRRAAERGDRRGRAGTAGGPPASVAHALELRAVNEASPNG